MHRPQAPILSALSTPEAAIGHFPFPVTTCLFLHASLGRISLSLSLSALSTLGQLSATIRPIFAPAELEAATLLTLPKYLPLINMTTRTTLRAFNFALSEYLLIALPVFLFVSLEAAHHHRMSWLWMSPEWSIATIFIVFRQLFLHYLLLHRSGRALNEPVLVLYFLGALLAITGALFNTWYSLGTNGPWAVAIRLILLVASSMMFLIFVGGAYFHYSTEKGRTNGP